MRPSPEADAPLGSGSEVPDASLAGRRLRAWRIRIFAATWLCYFGFYFCRKPFFIVKDELGTALSFSTSDLSLIGAAYLVAYTVGQFLTGGLGQRLGARVTLLAGMAISIGAGVGFGFAETLPWFVVLMSLNGLAQATGWGGTVGNMAAWFHRGERGTVMGFWATCFQAGGVAANGLAAYVLASQGFKESFFAGSVALLGIWIFFFFNQANRPEDVGLRPVVEPGSEPSAEPETDSQGSRRVGWSRGVWTSVLLIGLFYLGLKFIRYAIWSWAPFLLSRNFGLKGDEAGYLSTLFDLFGVAGVIVTGWLSDRVFHGLRARVSFFMLLGLVASTLLLTTVGGESVVLFAICLGLVGFTLYGPDALMSGAGAMDLGSERGAILAAGVINGFGSAGAVLQELLIGQSGGGLATVLALLLGSATFSGVVLAVILWRNRRGLSRV